VLWYKSVLVNTSYAYNIHNFITEELQINVLHRNCEMNISITLVLSMS